MLFGFGGCWMFLTGVLHLDLDLDMVIRLWYTYFPNFWLSMLILKVQRTFMSLKSWFEAFEEAGGSWLVLILLWSLIHSSSKLSLSTLILKLQRTSKSIKSSFGVLEDAGGSWLGFGILILIWIWSLAFDTPKVWVLALYLDFQDAENSYVSKVLVWVFGACCRCLTGVWDLDLDLYMFSCLLYTHDPNFSSLSWF